MQDNITLKTTACYLDTDKLAVMLYYSLSKFWNTTVWTK